MENIPQFITYDSVHDLDISLGAWLLPRIQKYKQETSYVPPGLSPHQWDGILDTIEQAAHALYNPMQAPLSDRIETIYAGLGNLAIYATHLWY